LKALRKPLLSSKEIAFSSIFGCISALSTLTTSFIPAPLPGLYAAISIPVSTLIILVVRTIIDKMGSATFTQFVSGVVSMLLPGGPPIKWLILPSWIAGGIIIDLSFKLVDSSHRSKLFYGILGSIYIIPGDLLFYWSFSIFLNWTWHIMFFLYGFVVIHAILGGLTGFSTPYLIERIRPVIGK